MRFFGEDLTCIRGERVVFAGLHFSLSPGEAVTLGGRNGSGKTSLLRLMAGLTPAASGRLAWDDGAVADEPERHRARLHFVGHLDAVKSVLSVRENLAQWALLRGGGRDAIAASLARFGLAALAEAPARYLSAGQRRRLSLARLAATPAVLWLLDEPTIALDRDGVAALYDAIAEHRAGGGMVVIATNVALALDDAAAIDMESFTVQDPLAEEAV
jgi:heme exporter protein A